MSATPGNRPQMSPSQRRGSWARAFDKVRAAMKRRSSSARTLPTTTTVATPAPEAAALTPSTQEAAVATSTFDHTETTPLQPRRLPVIRDDLTAPESGIVAPRMPTQTTTASLLVAADTDDEAADIPLLPMISSRNGVSEDRAQELFAKYGLEYGSRSRRQFQEPPNKIRRVEKPVRLRVHWTCHQCSRQFGMEKTCNACGHRRCRDCSRHPAKKVREILNSTRQQLESDQMLSTTASVPPTAAVAVIPAVDTTTQSEPTAPVQLSTTVSPELSAPTPTPFDEGTLLFSPLELDDKADEEELNLPNIQFSIYTRTHAGMRAVRKPKTQIIRRSCHKCNTQILPPSRSDCQNCGHARCELCPRYPPKKMVAPSQPETPIVAPTVQRVYRKPRQRVRYTCERCSTLFVENDRCFECGHERCQKCNREPPKRQEPTHDPAVVQAVADRLAAYSSGFGQPRGLAALAG